jgi:cyclopropane fatty-acyl-phospholipid synthase-like methyltransferase
MSNNPAWFFDESIQIGVDYEDSSVVEEYDTEHQGFRDFNKEAKNIYNSLGLTNQSTVLDIGCGTGGLSVELAKMCKHIYSVDASGKMIETLNNKISKIKINNITTTKAGFLTYEHSGVDIDAIVANITLHHLPDFWKQIALNKFYNLLSDNGKLFIGDVVFDFQPNNYLSEISNWIKNMKDNAGKKMSDETVVHIKEEYSTWEWIMTGMIERANFKILSKSKIMDNMIAYICEK